MGAEHVIILPNLFTYHEQNMIKSIIFIDFANNLCQGWFEIFQIMTTVKRGSQEWFKKFIKLRQGKEKLRLQNKYCWN